MKAMKRWLLRLLVACACMAALLLVGCNEPPAGDDPTPPDEPHVHTIVSHEGQEPTCTEDGWDPYETCAACDYTTYTSVTALGHDCPETYQPNGNVHSRSCTRCLQTIDQQPHEWQAGEMIKEPTCVNVGMQAYACACGANRIDTVDATGVHTEGEWVTTMVAAAFAQGKEELRCAVCRTALEERVIPAHVETMPILYMEGDYTAATKDKNDVQMTVQYVSPDGENFSAYALIHVQGATSAGLPKKNYTMKLYKDADCSSKFKVNLGWGKESKYCLKANWVDYTQARNIVACRLWGDMVKTRPASTVQARLAALPTNGGAIDGYPIAVYMNGEFYGLYTMNVPKDEWMFDMDDSETEALLVANDWLHTDFSVLVGEFTLDKNGDYVTSDGGWELKYFGTEDTTGSSAWVTESFNRLIRFCRENEGEAFKEGISQYMDVDAAIDYLILFYAIYMRDNTSKNMLWATYDGDVWIPSVYDQDGTFGMAWDGKRYALAEDDLPLVRNGKILVNSNLGSENFLLWDRMWNSFTEEILLRYKELRETILTEEYMCAAFEEFRACVPDSIYAADVAAWQTERAKWWNGDTYNGVKNWYDKFDWEYTYTWIADRLDCMDDAMRTIYNEVYLPNVDTPAL